MLNNLLLFSIKVSQYDNLIQLNCDMHYLIKHYSIYFFINILACYQPQSSFLNPTHPQMQAHLYFFATNSSDLSAFKKNYAIPN
jgi:hypothetical protein